MQNKGTIRFFAIAFAIVCLYQLSFTYFSHRVESNAREFADNNYVRKQAKKLAKGDASKETYFLDSLMKAQEKFYLDSLSNEVVYNLLIRKYTYKECKERELNLGLDLKGGMNVTLEVSVVDIVRAMSNNSQDPTFVKAVNKAIEMEKSSTKDFVTLFGEAFKSIDPNAKLSSPSIFGTSDLKDKINYNSTNDEVLKILHDEATQAIDRSYNILRTRIDRFGVTQPNIQRLSTSGRILIELPGIKDPDRVRKLLQGTAKLEFWETFENKNAYTYLDQANKRLAKILSSEDSLAVIIKDTTATTDKGKKNSLLDKIKKDSTAKKNNKVDSTKESLVQKLGKDTSKGKGNKGKQSFDQYAKENPLFAYLQPNVVQREGKQQLGPGATVGYADIKDTVKVNHLLRICYEKNIFPRNLKLLWTIKPQQKGSTFLELVAIKVTNREGKAPLGGEVVSDARQDFGQNGTNEISMEMNSEGAKIWKRLTSEHIGEAIAIVLDDYVYSAPTVQSEIPNGRSQITGNFTLQEAKDLANILKAGKLPAPAKIVSEEIVGPTLGQEAIDAGLRSFVFAFLLTLVFMLFYYNKAGMVADIALFTNMFFVFGILASLGAVLTLPGIAGIVLTIGMDVDKNVIIYERIREELRAGKGIRLAIDDGYKHAYSSIIDSNVTTLLTGIVLYIFGSGPVQGFASTLIIGILSSLFCAIFITRLIFIWMLDRNAKISVWNKMTKSILTNVKIDFIGVRKYYYILSLALVVLGVISLMTRGVSYGIDFLGGRSYVVRFDKNVRTDQVRLLLSKQFGKEPEVKTFGPSNQVKITTAYMIDNKSTKTDSIVEAKLYNGLLPLFTKKISAKEFQSHEEGKLLGKLSSQKVEPTIAYSLLKRAYLAVFFSLIIIFIYIAIRFKKWQWGLGGVISLFHDTFITLTMFSLFYGIFPFSLDIDQHFIAAILTIIGYSIMDSVIIFDRIREYQKLYPKRDVKTNMNDAINHTLSRTLITSGITFMVLLAMFIFGGEVIRGFAFALLFGVFIGTYSSVLNATPIAYDLIMWQQRRREKKELAKK